MAQIDELLKQAQERGASDLHLSPNAAPMARLNGEIVPLGGERISRDALQLMLFEIAEPAVRVRFEQTREAGFAYEVPGVVRVRCNLYEQSRGMAGALRLLPAGIPSLDDLGLPRRLGELVTRPCGLVVVSGSAGSGRSSTLAALVDHVNRTLCCHVVTLEDPIEFRHACHSSLVGQCEIGRHTPSLAQGVRAALHADADVIVAGAALGADAMEAVLDAAAGRLVLATLTASSGVHAVDAILDVLPEASRGRAAARLAGSLVAVLHHRLLRRIDRPGRVLALEVLLGTPEVATLIREQRTAQLEMLLRNRAGDGMQCMDEAVRALRKAGIVAAGTTSARQVGPGPRDAEAGGEELGQAA
jgi:twitching motility protein PilT